MPRTTVSIDNVAQIGLVTDTPAVALPPNAFSDLQNIRISDGALRKMEGEEEISFPNNTFADIQYIAWWPNVNLAPADGYYIVVDYNSVDDIDEIHLVKASDKTTSTLVTDASSGGVWQHTLFSGGYGFILNNGLETPRYILDTTDGSDISMLRMFPLPGWDSYISIDAAVDITYNTAVYGPSYPFNLGPNLAAVETPEGSGDFVLDNDDVTVVYNNADGEVTTVFTSTGTQDMITFAKEAVSDTFTITPASDLLATGDTLQVYVRSTGAVDITAGTVRTFGDTLVAGNLTESVGGVITKNLPGILRVSDVASPGTIPTNWNPFIIGPGTADEFVLSSTGIIQDMVELQGRLIIYTNNSIHALQPTGNSSIPYNIQNLTDAWGTTAINCVLEFDGKHLVIGSNDIYIFPGHPGNIQSIADDRVRRELFSTISSSGPTPYLLRNIAFDEIYVCYSTDGTSIDNALIWNYRDNTWTRRMMSAMENGSLVPMLEGNAINPNKLRPLFHTSTQAYYADVEGVYTDLGGIYQSIIQRERLAYTPEFDVEDLSSIALWTEGTGILNVQVIGTDVPAATIDFSSDLSPSKNVRFNVAEDYKSDVRVNGRFLSYQIDDGMTGQTEWNLSGIQLEVGKGGRR